MLETLNKSHFKIRIITTPKQIIQHLFLGTSLPILPEFREYILKDLTLFGAKALIMENMEIHEEFGEETDNIEGISLIYDDGNKDLLYFGFFGVFDHSPIKIEYLLEALITYAKKEGYKYIRGPINIPVTIFGWGFLLRGSKKDFHMRYNLNPPIYPELFQEKGFYTKIKEYECAMPILLIYPNRIPIKKDGKIVMATFDEFEYSNPGRDGMMKIKEEFLDLFARNLPESAAITPKPENTFDNLVKFIFDHGKEWMMWIVRYKPTGKICAGGYIIPDIFLRDENGELFGADLHAWVVDEEFRRRGLTVYQYAMTFQGAKKEKFPFHRGQGYLSVAVDNEANLTNVKKRMAGKIIGAKVILEIEL